MMTTPAGWYDDGSGRQRWWDGQQWTEHFAPVAEPAAPAEPQTPAEPAAEPEVPAASSEPEAPAETATSPEPATVISPEPETATSPEPETVVSPDPAPEWSAPGATAPTTPLGGDLPPYAAAAYPAQPEAHPAPATGYPGTAPGYPGAAPAYPAAGGYPGAAQAPGAPAYPATGGYQAPYGSATPFGAPAPTAPAPTGLPIVGLIGLGLAVVGAIIACIPLIAFIGWIVLGAGFIVSLVSLFLKGRKWPGIAGLIVSVVGTILSVVIIAVWFATTLGQISTSEPSSPPSFGVEGEDEDRGFGDPVEVVEGKMGETVTVEQLSGRADITVTAATWSASNGTDFPPANG